VACVGAGCAQAAEIRMLVSNAVKTSLEILAPEFERAAEHKLAITFGAASELKTEIDKGVAFDVRNSDPSSDRRPHQGRQGQRRRRADIAHAPVRPRGTQGASKPDIDTVEGFKQALLKANSIAYVEAGAGSPYFKSLLERLGSPTSQAQAQAAADQQSSRQSGGERRRPSSASQRSAKSFPMRAPKWPPAAGGDFNSIPSRPGGRRQQQGGRGRTCGAQVLTTPAAAAVLKAKGLEPG